MNQTTSKKVLIVVGTRPEAIKMAPVILAMQADDRFECSVCATGQHQEMLYQVLDWFGIAPDTRMNVMSHGQPLSHMAGRILNGLHTIVENDHPDYILVHGDTTTAAMASLVGYYSYSVSEHKPIQVVHIEAGLRTHDMYAPFPEEGNRVMIGHLSNWHFAPTETAKKALADENVTENVFVTGNTVIDALFTTIELLKKEPRNPLPQIPEGKRIILVTGHRRENYGEGFRSICAALRELAEKYPEDHIVYPVHLNPSVKDVVTETLADVKNIHLVRPMDYPDFVATMQRSYIILTDSGGIQEEAPSLGKPVLVMRDVTERPEAVEAGTVKVVGTDAKKLVQEASILMDNADAYNKMSGSMNPYGDGQATKYILDILCGEKNGVKKYNNLVA